MLLQATGKIHQRNKLILLKSFHINSWWTCNFENRNKLIHWEKYNLRLNITYRARVKHIFVEWLFINQIVIKSVLLKWFGITRRPSLQCLAWQTHTHTHTHTHTYTYTHTHPLTHTHSHTHTHTHTHALTHAHTHTHTHTHAHAHTQTHTHTHTHTLTHSHTHSHTHSLTLTRTQTHKHSHTRTHTNTHTHTHTHTHASSQRENVFQHASLLKSLPLLESTDHWHDKMISEIWSHRNWRITTNWRKCVTTGFPKN